jgi:hypothetical protein
MVLLITLGHRTLAFAHFCSQRLHLLLLILRKQVQLCGQQLKLEHRMNGRSNVERNLLNTLALVDLSLGCKAIR